MRTLRLVTIILLLILFSACGKQTSLNVSEAGSLIRAGNGSLYATTCLKSAASVRDVAGCRVSEGDNTPAKGVASFRGAVNGNYFDDYFFPGQGSNNNYYNWNYNQGWAWNPNQFQPNQWNNFFQHGSQQVWGDPYGWYYFLYGHGFDWGNYNGGSSICSAAYLDYPGFTIGGQGWNENYLLCGHPWSQGGGYGFHPGYGGYYPGGGESVVEMTNETLGQNVSRYTLSGTPSSTYGGQQRTYQITMSNCPINMPTANCSASLYRTIGASQFDHIVSLISRININTARRVQSDVQCFAQPNVHRILRAKNGAIMLSDRWLPCGEILENPDQQAKNLERYFLNLLGQPIHGY